MALRPDEFYDHALASADGERRLPLARMTGWEISPFEPDGLRVSPVLPEPARHGEDPSDVAEADAAGVADALVASHGGRRSPGGEAHGPRASGQVAPAELPDAEGREVDGDREQQAAVSPLDAVAQRLPVEVPGER